MEPTFNIRNEEAFTEDKILIQKILVCNLPKNVAILNLTQYFKRFGNVLKANFLGKGRNQKCCVEFSHSKDAAKALKETRHCLMNCVMRVLPCNSIYQPEGQILIEQLNRYFTIDAVPENNANEDASVLTLNDDCLELICKKLPPKDQINFALVCQRFCSVFVMVSKVEYAHLNAFTFDGWPQLQIRNFLQVVGPQVKNLLSFHLDEPTIRFLGLFCTNVEKLTIYSFSGINLIRKLSRNMHKIEELSLIENNLNDNFIKYLQKFKHLKYLDVSECGDLTGQNMHHLSGLKTLILRGCSSLTSYHFRSICKKLTNLQHLDVCFCDFLNNADYEHIAKHLLELETLNLSCVQDNFNCIAFLPKLKQLEISSDYSGNTLLIDAFLKNLAKYEDNKLEKLTIHAHADSTIASSVAKLKRLKILDYDCEELVNEDFLAFSELKELEQITLTNCDSISNKKVLKFLENCLHLVSLDLISCDSLTPEVISNALKLLQEQRTLWLRTDRVHMKLRFNKQNSSEVSKWHNEVDNNSQDVLKVDLDIADDVYCGLDSDDIDDFDIYSDGSNEYENFLYSDDSDDYNRYNLLNLHFAEPDDFWW